MPPEFFGSVPNVGVLSDARLAAMMRLRRSASVSVGTGGDARSLGEGSGSPRASRLAAMYDARSPPIDRRRDRRRGRRRGGRNAGRSDAEAPTLDDSESAARATTGGDEGGVGACAFGAGRVPWGAEAKAVPSAPRASLARVAEAPRASKAVALAASVAPPIAPRRPKEILHRRSAAAASAALPRAPRSWTNSERMQRQPQKRDGHDVAAPFRRVVPVTHQVGIAAFLHLEANGPLSGSREVDRDARGGRAPLRRPGRSILTTCSARHRSCTLAARRPRGSTSDARHPQGIGTIDVATRGRRRRPRCPRVGGRRVRRLDVGAKSE